MLIINISKTLEEFQFQDKLYKVLNWGPVTRTLLSEGVTILISNRTLHENALA